MDTGKMKTVQLRCCECFTDFKYSQKEFNRQTKKGRDAADFFCSISCSAKYRNRKKLIGTATIKNPSGGRSPGNQFARKYPKDTEPFRIVMKNITQKRSGNRLNQECDISIEYLKELWEQQDGKCAITGLPMTHKEWKKKKTPYTASLDRIDSSKGYVRGNVQWLATAINLAKNDFSSEVFSEFIVSLQKSSIP